MATQKELVAIVSERLGVPLETVTVLDRFLAEAGLRTRALRGRGSTPMTYRDAANLIIATALDSAPKNVVHLVSAYGSLKAYRVMEIDIDAAAFGQTFGESLAKLIDTVAVYEDDFSAHDEASNHAEAEVTLRGPTPHAQISLIRGGRSTTFEYGGIYGEKNDLRRAIQFTQVTLGFVGKAIAKDLPR